MEFDTPLPQQLPFTGAHAPAGPLDQHHSIFGSTMQLSHMGGAHFWSTHVVHCEMETSSETPFDQQFPAFFAPHVPPPFQHHSFVVSAMHEVQSS